MLFWIISGVFTLLTIGFTILPVLRSSQAPESPLDYDREIYKARVEEVKGEHDRGTLSDEEYEYTLAEEGRRFLAQTEAAARQVAIGWKIIKNPTLVGALFAGILIPAAALTGYFTYGSANLPDQPLLARLDINPQQQSDEGLLVRAELQLSKNPNDGRGWFAVARVYMRNGRIQDAINSYRNAIRILGATSELQSSLGEALTTAADGAVTEEARSLFNKAVAQDPTNVRGKFFLAIAFGQAGEYQKAIAAWKQLIEKSPKDAPWLDASRDYLQFVENKLGIKVPDRQVTSADKPVKPSSGARLPGNPSADDVRAAGQLTSSERQEFINTMVESLAAELQENPNNKAGWRRIIRSYTVLGRKADAQSAIQKARQIFDDDQQFLAELERNKQVLN